MQQEAERVGIVYTALAGYDPCVSATFWEKRQTYLEEYTVFRTHPVHPQKSAANRQVCAAVGKYYTDGEVHPDVEAVLKCNELFCNISSDGLKRGEGGGVFAVIKLLADTIIKNEMAEDERKKQQAQIAEANRLLASQQRLTPPNVDWAAGWNVYKCTIERHNEKAGFNFGLANGQGQFFYNFNNAVHQGNMQFSGQNEFGYWFNWQDHLGNGRILLQEFTDVSMRGQIFMEDGTNPGKLLGSSLALSSKFRL